MRPHQTILVVDDDPSIRFILNQMLEQRGYKVIAVEGGDDAWNYLLDSLDKVEALPELIICDLNMRPQMSGMEFALKKKNHPDLKDIPLIIFTGEVNVATVEGCVFTLKKGETPVNKFMWLISSVILNSQKCG